MLDRVKNKFELHPERIIADTAYGSGPILGWLVDRKIAPHIPVWDKSKRTDGTFMWAHDGAPLYTWVGDSEKGDVSGEGMGGVWHVAKP